MEITDVNQQTIGRSVRFCGTAPISISGSENRTGVMGPGKPLKVEICPSGREGKPWTTAGASNLVLRRVDWESVLVQGAGNSVRYRNKAILTNVWEKESRDRTAGAEGDWRRDDLQGHDDGRSDPGAGRRRVLLEVSSQDESRAAGGEFGAISRRRKHRTAWNYRNEYE